MATALWLPGANAAPIKPIEMPKTYSPFVIGVSDLVADLQPVIDEAPAVTPVVAADGTIDSAPIDANAVLSDPDADVAPLPVIRRRLSLEDGNKEQYQIAIRRPVVQSTKRNRDINAYFVDAPEPSGMALTLRDVVLYTLKNSPDIAIARWRSEDAREAIDAARAPRRPQVEIAAASGVEGVQFENINRVSILQRSEASLRVSKTLLDFGRTGQAVKRAKALYQSQTLQRTDVVDETVFAAVTAYLNLLGAEQLVASSKENVAAHERIVALVEKNFDAGNLSEAETKRSRTRLDRARTNAIDLENSRERAMSEFRRITGLEPQQLVEPELDIALAYELNNQTLDGFLQDNPALQSALRDINSLEHQITATSRANLPEVSMQVAGALRENVLGTESWTTDARAMLAARWTAYDGGAASARKRQLLARKKEAEATLLQLRNELRQDGSNIISVLTTSRDKRSIFEEQVVDSLRVVELYEKQFDAGRRTLLELLDAQADLAAAQEENIATKYENLAAALASLRIQNALVRDLTAQLELPNPD